MSVPTVGLSLLFNQYNAYFLGLKRPGCEDKDLLPCNGEVLKVWRYTATTHMPARLRQGNLYLITPLIIARITSTCRKETGWHLAHKLCVHYTVSMFARSITVQPEFAQCLCAYTHSYYVYWCIIQYGWEGRHRSDLSFTMGYSERCI